MKDLQSMVFFICFGVVASGCFPYRFTIVPGATGKVVDAQSGTPIGQAIVNLSDRYRLGEYDSTVQTTADGHFAIPAKQTWGLFIAPFDPAPAAAVVNFQANGYAEAEKRISITIMGPAITNLGTVPMSRSTQ